MNQLVLQSESAQRIMGVQAHHRNGLGKRELKRVNETREMARHALSDGLECSNLIKSGTYKSSTKLLTAQPNLLMRDRSTLQVISQLTRNSSKPSLPVRQSQP